MLFKVIEIGEFSFFINEIRVVMAAIMSLLITSFIVMYLKFSKLAKDDSALFQSIDSAIYSIKRCRALYPKPYITFNGKRIDRGTFVRVTLADNKSYEGNLIGANDNMEVCIFTETNLIAQDLKYVINFEALEDAKLK